MRITVSALTRYLSDLVFPERCVFCGMPTGLHADSRYICAECKKDMPYLNSVPDINREQIQGISVFEYDFVRKTIFLLKYDGYRHYADVMGGLMADYVLDKDIKELLSVDIAVPVPLWRSKEKDRGFNQSALLAEAFCKRTGMACDEGFLVRSRNTKPQKGLGRGERQENLRDAFELNDGRSAENKSFLIIDDIFTTGTTVFECAKTLYAEGADRVCYLALSSPAKRRYDI